MINVKNYIKKTKKKLEIICPFGNHYPYNSLELEFERRSVIEVSSSFLVREIETNAFSYKI